MRPVVILVLSLFACAAASGSIKPLYETDSITAYDRWLWQHRNEYPGFRPVRVRVGEERSGSGWTRLTAVFLTDSGTELVRHVYPDSWQGIRMEQVSNINVKEVGDYSVVYRRGVSTAYDRLGRKLFDGGVYPRFNLWFRNIKASDTVAEPRPWLGHAQPSESTQVLDDEGKVIGVLPRVSTWTATGSGDTLFAAVSYGGTVVFDRTARVRWRDSLFGIASRIAAISPDGRTVAVVTRESVGLHDLVTGKNKVLGLDSAAVPRYRARSVVWSNDSRRIVVWRDDRGVPDSALLSVIARNGEPTAPSRKLETDYAQNLFWMGDTVVMVASPFLPNPKKWMSDKPYHTGPCRVIAVTSRSGIQTWTVPGRFGQLGVWYLQGRSFAYVDRDRGYYAVFQVPVK